MAERGKGKVQRLLLEGLKQFYFSWTDYRAISLSRVYTVYRKFSFKWLGLDFQVAVKIEPKYNGTLLSSEGSLVFFMKGSSVQKEMSTYNLKYLGTFDNLIENLSRGTDSWFCKWQLRQKMRGWEDVSSTDVHNFIWRSLRPTVLLIPHTSKASGHVLGFHDLSLPSEFFDSYSVLKIFENSELGFAQNTAQGKK